MAIRDFLCWWTLQGKQNVACLPRSTVWALGDCLASKNVNAKSSALNDSAEA